jgi:hypothetical protein
LAKKSVVLSSLALQSPERGVLLCSVGSSELDRAQRTACAAAAASEVERLVDLIERHHVSDQWVDLDLFLTTEGLFYHCLGDYAAEACTLAIRSAAW